MTLIIANYDISYYTKYKINSTIKFLVKNKLFI